MTLAAPANSDTLVSTAFARPAAWRGTVSAVTSPATIGLAGSPGWTANQWAPSAETFYLRLMTGAIAGAYFVVSGNSAAAVTVDSAGVSLSTISAGDQAEIAPFWTLGTFYPANQVNDAFIPSATSLIRQTELLFYDPAAGGVNRSPAETFYFFNGAWRKVGAPVTTSFNSRVVLPDTYFLQRNKASATRLRHSGRVFTAKLATLLNSLSSSGQDNYVALAHPRPVTLRGTNLVSSGAFVASPSALIRKDELLVYDPTQPGSNRSPSATYFYFNGGWRKVGSPLTQDFSDSVTLLPGSGFIIRKAASGSTSVWIFDTSL